MVDPIPDIVAGRDVGIRAVFDQHAIFRVDVRRSYKCYAIVQVMTEGLMIDIIPEPVTADRGWHKHKRLSPITDHLLVGIGDPRPDIGELGIEPIPASPDLPRLHERIILSRVVDAGLGITS